MELEDTRSLSAMNARKRGTLRKIANSFGSRNNKKCSNRVKSKLKKGNHSFRSEDSHHVQQHSVRQSSPVVKLQRADTAGHVPAPLNIDSSICGNMQIKDPIEAEVDEAGEFTGMGKKECSRSVSKRDKCLMFYVACLHCTNW